MNRTYIAAVSGVALAIALSCTAGGCGSSGGGGGGGAAAASGCSFDTFLNAPVHQQIVATSTVTCALLVETATTTLVIQGRKTGSGAAAWDNFDDPKSITSIPPSTLTYTVTCIGGYDYQASADITGVYTDDKPFHFHGTTPVVSYSAADCAQN